MFWDVFSGFFGFIFAYVSLIILIFLGVFIFVLSSAGVQRLQRFIRRR